MSKLNDIFKAYILTKGKVPTRKYTDPENQYTLEQVQGMPEYAGILAEEAVLVDIDDGEEGERLLDIIRKEGVKCRVHKTDSGIHCFFLGHHMGTTKTKTCSAVGFLTDWKLGTKNGISILKIHGDERPVIYDTDEIGPLPAWLYPVPKLPAEFLSMGEGSGRNDELYRYILTLQTAGLTKDEARECIGIINKHVFKEPLSERELNTITRDDAFPSESFYDSKGKLQVRKFEEHFCREVHALKLDKQLHIYRDGIYVKGDDVIRGRMLDFLPDLNYAQRNEILNRSKDRIQTKGIRASANIIVFRNGTFDLRDDTFGPHSAKNVVTNLIDWNYNPDAYSEVADRTFDKLACHNPRRRALLEELIGYCFYRRNELGKGFLLLGDKSNGKSTYLEVLNHILGEDNVANLNIQDLDKRFKPASLMNMLANIGDDIPKTWVPDSSMLKKLITGSRISTEFKGKDEFTYAPFAKFIFSANEPPRIDDETGAVLRRMVFIPFNAVFSPDDPDFDPYIIDKLKAEESIEYIIRVAVEGLKRVLSVKKFTTDEEVDKELKNYDQLNNPLLYYLDEKEMDEILNHTTQQVFDGYRDYCFASGFTPMAINSFVRQMNKRLGMTTVRRMVQGKRCKVFELKEVDE